MKIGTDAVLLGAWTDVLGARRILDVGTGTGIIALMLAQRSEAQITAIEIEENAADEAAGNARKSPWEERISVDTISFQEYAKTSKNKYDCIVSNPPFFSGDLKSANSNLALARHNDLLSLPDIVEGATKLLSENGRLNLIFPVETALNFINLAEKKNLYLTRLTWVSSSSSNKVHRYLLEFSKKKLSITTDFLNIRNDDGLDYSPEYKNLTCDFYLKFKPE